MQRRRARRLISSYAEGGRDVSPQPHESGFETNNPYTPQKLKKNLKNDFLLENTTEASAPPFPLQNMQPWLETQTSD